MNHKLYIRKGANRSNALFSLIFPGLIILIVIKSWTPNNSFLKYSKLDYYNSVLDSNKGFTGRVNKLLENLLDDTAIGDSYDIKKINEHYNSLKFKFSIYDSSYSFLKISNIIVDSIIPIEEDDKLFFHNSYLKEVVDKQNKYRNIEYFDIKFDDENGYRIKSITINPELYRMRLSQNFSDTKILIRDPIAEIDSNAIFFISGKSVLPIFSGDSALIWQNADGLKLWNNDLGLKLISESKSNVDFVLENELENCYLIAKENKSIRILIDGSDFTGDDKQSYLRIVNNKDNFISYGFENTDSLICYKKGVSNLIPPKDSIYKLNVSELPIKFTYKRKDGTLGDFYFAKNSPLEIATRNYANNSINSNFNDLFTQQFVSSINDLPKRLDTTVKTRTISLNSLFSHYLENQITDYANNLKVKYPNDIIEMSISIIESKNGEIIASPFYSTEFQEKGFNKNEAKNFNLTKHFIGSTFKPLLANASSILYPSLENLKIGNSDFSIDRVGRKSSILGYPFSYIPFSENGEQWKGCDNRSKFLSKSSDLYPITMVMISLTEGEDKKAFTALTNNKSANKLFELNDKRSSQRIWLNKDGTNTFIKNISDSKYINLISDLYGVEKDGVSNNSKYCRYDKIYDSAALRFKLNDIPGYILPELVSLNSNKLGSDHANNNDQNSDFNNLTSWILGQGANEWTNIQLANAYSRLFTKRDTRLSYFTSINKTLVPDLITLNQDNLYKETKTDIKQEWIDFLDCFSKSNEDGSLLKSTRDTFKLLHNNKDKLLYDIAGLTLVGKTGSPDEYDREDKQIISNLGKRKYFDEGLYSFGILKNYNSDSTAGVNCIIHIRRITLNKIPKGVKGINSVTAKDFLTKERLKNIVFFNRLKFKF